jgi:hypothetical protein
MYYINHYAIVANMMKEMGAKLTLFHKERTSMSEFLIT